MITVNPLAEQLQAIWYAAFTGAGLGILYDIFRMIRWKSRNRLLEFLLDFLFSAAAAIVLFLLVTAVTQLRVRGFLLLALAVGWLLWNILAGRLFRWLLEKIWGIFCATASIVRRVCLLPMRLHRKNNTDFLEK